MKRQGIFDTPSPCLYADIQSAIYGGCTFQTKNPWGSVGSDFEKDNGST